MDAAPKSKARKQLVRSKKAVKKYATSVKQIDLGAKKLEVNGLLDEITHAAKSYISRDERTLEVLPKEVVESVASWLNDVWSIAVEEGADYAKMHSCLLFSVGVLDHLRSLGGG